MILLLGQEGDSTRIVYNHLRKAYGDFPVIIENGVAKKNLIKNRVRKLGLPRVALQLAFMVGMRPILSRIYKQRVDEIIQAAKLDTDPIPNSVITRVESANSPQTLSLLRGKAPKVIVVNGTRIISKSVLDGIDAVFINTHMGITPAYRGVHGGYWALHQNDAENFGVTVHLVDPGVDTGSIIAQARISPTSRDAFPTYPYLQIAAALPLIKEAVASGLDGSLRPANLEGASALWYHPTIFQYLGGLFRGVR